MQRAIRIQGGYETEYRILLPDGKVRWIAGRGRCLLEGDGKSTRLLGVSMDITERKQAQELFQLATEASPSDPVGIRSATILDSSSFWPGKLRSSIGTTRTIDVHTIRLVERSPHIATAFGCGSAANDRLGFRPRLWNSTSRSLES